jgi:hypothetical protein
MRVMLVQKAVSLVVALAVFAAAPGGVAIAAKKSAAQTCQKEIDKASQQYTKTKLKKLFSCGKKTFKKDGDVTACIGTASASIPSKQVKKLDKSCPSDVIGGTSSEDALGITTCVTRGPGCAAPTDADSLAACIECSHKFEADCLFRTVYNASTPECEMP